MRLHERAVFRLALGMLGNVEDAEEASQEVFLRFFRYLDRFDEAREPGPWLYRLCVNVCNDLARKRKRWRQALGALVREQRSQAAHPPDRAAILAETERTVIEGLDALSKKERAVFVLRDIEGAATSEIARILKTRETTVRSHLSRARMKIKAYYERRIGK